MAHCRLSHSMSVALHPQNRRFFIPTCTVFSVFLHHSLHDVAVVVGDVRKKFDEARARQARHCHPKRLLKGIISWRDWGYKNLPNPALTDDDDGERTLRHKTGTQDLRHWLEGKDRKGGRTGTQGLKSWHCTESVVRVRGILMICASSEFDNVSKDFHAGFPPRSCAHVLGLRCRVAGQGS